ncbi:MULTISPECIES: hypothetical protein [Myxococcaceae]|uniref:hypothetical protein n=1 Tax=Myxococcaceae TaxID=31 RepID=UPI00129C8601|nr:MULTISPECIES: hypothetical protein [Myxococcaceae]MBF5042836.1 hypothetical protein [Simulacricoccus sp. 17bor-14]
MFKMGMGELLFVVLVPLVYGLLFVGLIALGTLVARRVWRWDERREQAGQQPPQA